MNLPQKFNGEFLWSHSFYAVGGNMNTVIPIRDKARCTHMVAYRRTNGRYYVECTGNEYFKKVTHKSLCRDELDALHKELGYPTLCFPVNDPEPDNEPALAQAS